MKLGTIGVKFGAIWSFIAGDSRRTPLAVATAVVVVTALQRLVPAAAARSGALFVAIIVAGLIGGVSEQR